MDVTLDIVERSIVGLILLGLVEQGEEMIGALIVGEIVVDEADEDALALRELLETFLEITLGVVRIDFSELGEDLTVV